MSDSPVDSNQAGVWINLRFFPLAFFLFMCTPQVEVDGALRRLPWGRHFVPVGPGAHTLRVWFAYFGMRQCGLSSIELRLASGEFAHVDYFMPPWMYARGSLRLVAQ
jgi:hypothetical protein